MQHINTLLHERRLSSKACDQTTSMTPTKFYDSNDGASVMDDIVEMKKMTKFNFAETQVNNDDLLIELPNQIEDIVQRAERANKSVVLKQMQPKIIKITEQRLSPSMSSNKGVALGP